MRGCFKIVGIVGSERVVVSVPAEIECENLDKLDCGAGEMLDFTYIISMEFRPYYTQSQEGLKSNDEEASYDLDRSSDTDFLQ